MVFEKRILLGKSMMFQSPLKYWIERILESVRGYKLENIWNMDELGQFFKLLPDKSLIENAKSNI